MSRKEELLKQGREAITHRDRYWMVLEIMNGKAEPEMIINPRANIEAKLASIEKSFNDDLELYADTRKKIVNFNFTFFGDLMITDHDETMQQDYSERCAIEIIGVANPSANVLK